MSKTSFTLRQRLRYRFDNSITKGQGAFVGWLIAFGFTVATLITAASFVIQGAPEGSFASGFRSLLWKKSRTILFDDKIPDGNLRAFTINTLVWLASVTISATIIAFVSNKLRERIEKLRKGDSEIVESGHTLILGWSNRIFPVIQQLVEANSNTTKPLIVVYADRDREDMEDEIASRSGDLGKTRVVVRKGDPTNPATLTKANVAGASSIIILDADSTGDSAIISTILAIKAASPDTHTPIVAEIDDLTHGQALSAITDGRVLSVQSNQIISRVTAQASRQPGLASVVLDLLDFEGDEIYFQNLPALAGKSYGDALLACEMASVIGIRRSSGEIAINPSPSTLIAAGDEVIAIAQDDDRVTLTGLRDDLSRVTSLVPGGASLNKKAEHLLVIGWSEMGNTVMEELAPFLAQGSTLHIVANPNLVDTSQLPGRTFSHVPVTYSEHRGSISDLAKAASAKQYDEVIVLAYRENISVADADAQTMMTMLLMNKLFDEDGNGVERARLVAEILDSRKAQLARVANADDLVVSDNLAALMVAQVSQNSQLSPVFQDLFDADGASINVRPIETYVPLGSSQSYAHLVAAARARGESAIGYRIGKHPKGDPTGGVTLNPAKSVTFTATAGDALIVIGAL